MSETNLRFYEKSRAVPQEAQKSIGGGRLKGMTDINPMWRIKKLTELFGPAGIGWVFKVLDQRMITGAQDQIAVFVDVELRYKDGDAWSEPVYGTGGSMFVTKEAGGLYTDDEAYKKAYTDAQSVACKALGIGADVYWQKDATKYTEKESGKIVPAESSAPKAPEEPAKPSEFVGAEAAKLRKLIIDLGASAGRDEAKVRMFAEELVERATKTFVKFDDMDVGILTKVKIELANKIAGK